MAFTFATIKTRLTNRLKDVANISNDVFYQMATDLNQFLYNEMFGTDPERFITTSTYTVTSSPSTQALPAGYRDIQETGCGFFVQNTDGSASTEQLRPTSYGSKDYGYYISSTNVVFTGFNTTKTIILRYIPTLSDITTTGGTFVVPDENKELVTEGMVLYYYRYQEDPREGEQDLRFKRLLELFIEGLPKSPKVGMLPSKLNSSVSGVRNDIPIYY